MVDPLERIFQPIKVNYEVCNRIVYCNFKRKTWNVEVYSVMNYRDLTEEKDEINVLKFL